MQVWKRAGKRAAVTGKLDSCAVYGSEIGVNIANDKELRMDHIP